MKDYLEMTDLEKIIDEMEDTLETLEVLVYSVKHTLKELRKMKKKTLLPVKK